MDENVEKKETSATSYKSFLIVILIMAFLIVFAAAGLKIKEMGDQIRSQKIELYDKTENIKQMYNVLGQANQKIEMYILQLDLLKTKEEAGRKDLEAYILKKYRTVPKEVAREVALQVTKLTKEEAVPFSIIVGLIEVESQFKPWAISKKDARGLMQVIPWWITNEKANLGIADKHDLHDIEINIRAGIKIFKIHLKEANNDINQGLYLYVGKDSTYAGKVLSAMGRFEIFRSTLDTALRAKKNQDTGPDADKKADWDV